MSDWSSDVCSSDLAGCTPKNGLVADPGLVGIAPGSGEIMMPPVSVCHQVSTIGSLPLPTTSPYKRQASGLIGSPTPPRSRSDLREVFFTGPSHSLLTARIAARAAAELTTGCLYRKSGV